MIHLQYGTVWTEVRCPPPEKFYLDKILTFGDAPSLLEGDQFLSGLLEYATERLTEQGVPWEVRGVPEPGKLVRLPKTILPGIELYPYQHRAGRKGLTRRRGIIDQPTGSGKTEISCALATWFHKRKGKTLMIVPGVNSMTQTVERFRERGLTNTHGMSGDYPFVPTADCVIAVANSALAGIRKGMYRKEFLEFLFSVECLIFMEAHHLPSHMWTTIGTTVPAPVRLALSATPFGEGTDPSTADDYRLIGLTGQTISRLPAYVLMNQGYLPVPFVHMLRTTGTQMSGNDWRKLYTHGITGNIVRNEAIVTSCIRLLANDHRIMILVSEVSHGDHLARLITDRSSNEVMMFTGGSSLTTYKKNCDPVAETVEAPALAKKLKGRSSYLLIGSPALDEDFDLPSMNVLIPAGGGKAFRRVVQRAGRVLRKFKLEDGTEPQCHVIDFDDNSSWVLRNHSSIRRSIYKDIYGPAQGFKMQTHTNVTDMLRSILGQ